MRVRVVLACTECSARNYSATKDKAKHPERLERKKFCAKCNEHTLHRETR